MQGTERTISSEEHARSAGHGGPSVERGWPRATDVRRRRGCSPTAASSEPRVIVRLVLVHPENAHIGLGSIEADLDAGSVGWVERLVAEGEVTEGLQQAAGDILQAAEQTPRRLSILSREVAKQAACFYD